MGFDICRLDPSHRIRSKEKGAINSLQLFLEYAKKMESPSVLELGTFQSIPGRSTMHRHFVPHAMRFHGTDVKKGPDVDFVADAHELSKYAGTESYDIIISCSTFEHFKYPHIAAMEISKVLRLGGACFIQTHSCFPLHAYPFDYYRFSREALAGCFGSKNGIRIMKTDYEFPCVIVSEELGNRKQWLNVNLFGIKTSTSPTHYEYEFDVKP